ncbi:hypothetical protein Btru_039638 [Bulinus truncatus]|nr:hypothetical protein Btru_039638 [Bulinus truncatus]
MVKLVLLVSGLVCQDRPWQDNRGTRHRTLPTKIVIRTTTLLLTVNTSLNFIGKVTQQHLARAIADDDVASVRVGQRPERNVHAILQHKLFENQDIHNIRQQSQTLEERKEWASPTSRLGQVLYDTYVEQDFIDMAKLYNYVSGVGYDKPNMTENAHPEKKRWDVTLLSLYKYIGLNFTTCVFWVKAVTKDEQTITKYGAPKVFYIKYDMEYSGAPWLNITFLMLGKTTTRLPESISFGFQPVNEGCKWTLEKMAQYIDPCDVVLNGSQYVHGIKSDVNLLNQDNKGIQFYSRDVPIVNLGTENHIDSPFPVPLQPFECSTLKNFSFNIFNNIWNTNYPMWYPFNQEDENFKAEFTISFIN